MEEPEHIITTPRAAPRTLGSGYAPAEVRRALWLIMLAWIFGASFSSLSSGAVITSFLTKYLKADDFGYGLVMAAGPAAALLLFLGSDVNERSGQVKRNFLIFVTLHRLLWLGVAVVAVLPGVSTPVKVALVGGIIFLSTAATNYGGGAGWIAWMSGIVPKRIAGSYFGMRASLGMLSMIASSIAAAYLLDRFGATGWLYAGAFGVAAILGAMDILTFLPIREIPRPVEQPLPTFLDILVTPWSQPTFRRYVIYISIAYLSYTMVGNFQWRFCMAAPADGGLGMSLTWTNLNLFIFPLLIQAVFSPFWGRAIDRFGPKPVLVTSALGCFVLPFPWIFLHPALCWLVPGMQIVTAFFSPGNDQMVTYMQLRGFPETRRTAYIATFMVVFGLSCMIGSSLGGVLAAFWKTHLHLIPGLPVWVAQYQPVFLIGFLIRIVAFLVLLLPLQLPGAPAGVGAVTRAVTAGAASTISQVGRAVKRRQREGGQA